MPLAGCVLQDEHGAGSKATDVAVAGSDLEGALKDAEDLPLWTGMRRLAGPTHGAPTHMLFAVSRTQAMWSGAAGGAKSCGSRAK